MCSVPPDGVPQSHPTPFLSNSTLQRGDCGATGLLGCLLGSSKSVPFGSPTQACQCPDLLTIDVWLPGPGRCLAGT